MRIGDSEASVLPLVRRYRGHKWAPPGSTRGDIGPRDRWADSEEYERALRTYPDYIYSIQVNAWGSPTSPPISKSAKALMMAMVAIPSGLRSPLGLRDWGSFVDIRIRDGRVSDVGGAVFVEGRSRWLNHSWHLANEERGEPLPRPYTIGPQDVLMWRDRSRGIRNLISPQASEEQAEAAHIWNRACVVSLRGCRNRCELSPRAFAYWKTHPAKSGAIWEPTCE